MMPLLRSLCRPLANKLKIDARRINDGHICELNEPSYCLARFPIDKKKCKDQDFLPRSINFGAETYVTDSCRVLSEPIMNNCLDM